MSDQSETNPDPMPESDRPVAVLAATDRPIAIEVREIADDRVPEGMRCLGTFLDAKLVARCAVVPGALDFFAEHEVFAEPRQLLLAAREAEPGLQCELYAIVPMPESLLDDDDRDAEPWAVSVPSSHYDRLVRESDDAATDGAPMAAILLGSIVRFRRDRKHPDSLPLETMDILARIVAGETVNPVDKVLEDLLGP